VIYNRRCRRPFRFHERRSAMSEEKKSTSESFGDMLTAFGSAISEIFNDPELKEKAKDFGDAAAESAKALGKRFKDQEVKDKLREAGKAAEELGKSVADYFQSHKDE